MIRLAQDKSNVNQEALHRAKSNQSTLNYLAIISGFESKGIAPTDIIPRENVFTYRAWKALGRQVCKGAKGVKVKTWVPIDRKKVVDGVETIKTITRPKFATVFHVSQTKGV